MSNTTLLDLSRRPCALTPAMQLMYPAATVGTGVFEYRDSLLRALV